MARTAVQFGAGNIGRGFIAQLFHESGLEVVFVEVAPEVVDALNSHKAYEIEIAGLVPEFVEISNVRAINAKDVEAVANAVAECEVASTAVGAGSLKYIAPNIAAGLALRRERGRGPLNILICENLHNAAAHLRELVRPRLDPECASGILDGTGFVQTVVSRMVPLAEKGNSDPLAVRVESYKRLPIDGAAIVGHLPPIVGVEPVQNFRAHVDRKLYTHNCGHAVLGYAGYFHGLQFGYDALEHYRTREILNGVLAETSESLVRKHGFERAEQDAHVDGLLVRFANRALRDTCFRLGKDPIRKLAPDDRLVGAARLCESQGVAPVSLTKVIAYALCFDPMEDEPSVRLQTMIRSNGVESVLSDICAISVNETLGRAVIEAYRELRAEQSRR